MDPRLLILWTMTICICAVLVGFTIGIFKLIMF
jgi:hypothetical protein